MHSPFTDLRMNLRIGEGDCLVTIEIRLPARAQRWCERSLEQRRLKLMHAWQLQTMTDKGSLFTDSTIKSHTVVEFTSGKGYA